MKKTRRDYRGHNGEKLVGVTSVIGLLNKPALLGWAARVAAEATAEAILDGGASREMAITIGKAAHLKRRDHAADLGTRAHELVEQHYTSGPPIVDVSTSDAAKVHGAYSRVVALLDGSASRVLHCEVALEDKDAQFGGTIDGIVERNGLLYVFDLKTGKAAYDETIIQLGAYRHLWQLHNPTMPLTGGGLLIHSPIDGVATEIHVTPEQLSAGAAIFAALLAIHKTLPQCKLNRPEIEKGIP